MADFEKKILLQVDFNVSNYVKESQRLQKEINDVKARQAELKKGSQENSAEYVQNASQIRMLSKNLSDNNRIMDAAVKTNKLSTGSINEMRAALSVATDRWNNLSEAEREASVEGEQLQGQIKHLSDTLKEQESSIGDNRRNVGNYADALKGLGGPVGGAVEGVKGFNTALKDNPIMAIVGLLLTFAQQLGKNAKVMDTITFVTNGFNKALQIVVDSVVELIGPLKQVFENPKQAIIDLVDLIKNNLINRFKALGVIVDGVMKADFKQITNGVLQFGSGVEDVVGKVQNFGNKIAAAGKEGFDAAKKLDAFAVSQANINAQIAKNNGLIAEQEQQLKDISLSFENRKRIAGEVADLEIKNAQLEKKRAQEARDIERLKLKDKELTGEEEARLVDLQTAVEVAASRERQINAEKSRRIALLLKKEETADNRAEREAQKADEKGLTEEIAKLKIDIIKDAQGKEKALIDYEFQQKLSAIQGQGAEEEELRKLLAEQKNQKIAEVEKKYSEERIKKAEEEAAQVARLSEEAVKRNFEQQQQSLQADLLQIEASWMETFEKRRELLDLEYEQRLNAAIANGDSIALVNAQFAEKEKAIEEEKLKAQSDFTMARLETAKLFTDGLNNLFQIFSDNAEASAEFAKLVAVVQIGIDTAKAISGAVAQAQLAGPFPANLLAIATGVAAVTANILRAKQMLSGAGSAKAPTYKKAAKGGVFGGEPHSNGGTKGVFSDGTHVEVERGELFAVINKNNSSMLSSLSSLNSWGGNGVPFMQRGGVMHFADGGAVSGFASAPVTDRFTMANEIGMIAERLPAPIVSVQEIIDTSQKVTRIVQRGDV